MASRLGRLFGRPAAAGAERTGPDATTRGGGVDGAAEPRLPVDTSLVTDRPTVAPDGFDVVVTVQERSFRDGAHRPSVAAAVAAGARTVVVSAYDVHAGPTSTYAPVEPAADHVVAQRTVAATWGGAVAAARAQLRSATVVVQDAAITLPEGAHARLVATVGREARVAVAVVRSADDVVLSAGASLPQPTAPVASLLRGHPAEDADRLDGTAVFAADLPCFAAPVAALADPVRTVDTRTAVARLTRDTADDLHGDCVLVPLGRAYGDPAVRERRYDADAADALAVWRGRRDECTAPALECLGFLPARGTADPVGAPVALREPVVRAERGTERLSLRDRGERLRWSLRIAAHPGARGDDWGDTFFARDLARALRGLGQEVVVDHRESHVRPFSEHLDDVALTLRGLDDTPVHPSATNVLWVISHPDLVTPAELARYDLRFAAGPVWATRVAGETGLPVAPLLQATDPARFHPGAPDAAFGALDTAFVGKTRRVFRPVVRDAVEAGVDLAVWGEGWEGLLPEGVHRGVFVANDELPALYRTARVVLNDHWDDMARDGFLSNRLFDAAASGALVVTDPVPGVDDLFHGAVRTYTSVEQLRETVRAGESATLEERVARGERIGAEHSFRNRAETLLDAVRRVRAQG
ncbi:glycosyltransferase [Curtobacterium sp. ODYSSEY 48 V2]|uniref:glycosyltransferase family protein n=1 Tax=Curtobacterium sp. ODYSSEY 48 V2 TaxID=2939561 RepID=UPI00203C0667|nr:glycosyltransferase [Curtobacterium sp. ODYSSEY 48 V2]MCM3506259.1 glycosyltransferase [Curtobacterium sp. ODYSSEY 48 V2]